MRLIRLYKIYIIKRTSNNYIRISFRFGTHKKTYDDGMTISNYVHDNKIVARIFNDNNWVHYGRYMNGTLLFNFIINKLFNYSQESYFVNKCLIKNIEQRHNNYTYLDYEYEKTEYYNWNPKVKNSIMNNIRNSKLYQFIKNMVSK